MQLHSNSPTTKSRLNDWKSIRVELFDWLLEAVTSGQLQYDAAQQQLDTWQEFFEKQPQSERLLTELQKAKALLWCANVAATNRSAANLYATADSFAALCSDAPDFIQSQQSWAFDCVQLFSHKGATQSALSIPIALCPQAAVEGRVATFVLALSSRGSGQIFQHPCDSLTTYAHDDFSKAITDAWEAAKLLVKGKNEECNVDALWRVLDEEGKPIEEVEGRSASAAAAYGFYHLLNGRRPDNGLIVMAQIDGDDIYQLKGVGKIYEKTQAIIKHGGFDSIIVASEENRAEVEKAIAQANGNAGHQTLFPPNVLTTLEALKSARSHFVQELIDYLDALAKRAAELPAYYPAHLRGDEAGKTPFDDLRQMVQIVEDRSLFHEWLAKEREQMKAAGFNGDLKAYNPLRSRPETEGRSAEKLQARMPKPPIQWDERAGGRFRRAVILADPGFGKTWLLRYEARRIARQSLKALREFQNNPAEIEFPILARLSDLNQSDSPVEDALTSLVGNSGSYKFRRYVADKLKSDRCVVLLDAWDEVPEEKPKTGEPVRYRKHYRQRLEQRLKEFAEKFKALRLLMTSRIVSYSASPIPEAQELEIISFDTPQIESFAQVWFGNHAEAKAGFLDMLRQNQSVRGLSRIPLMLALVCRVYEVGAASFPTRRVELYDRCLKGLLKDWKEEKACSVSDSLIDAMLEMLAPVSLALFEEGYEQFSESILRRKVIDWLKRAPVYHELREEKPAALIAALKQDGILISAGDYTDAPLLFLHRTFQEYLAASELARRANEEGWQTIASLIDKKAWDTDWQEVIILLAGKMNNPLPLLEMLLDESRDDYFRHRLALAARCLAEIEPETRNQHSDVVDKITSEAVLLWWSRKLNDTEATVEHLAKTFSVLARVSGKIENKPLLDWADEKLNEVEPNVGLALIGEIGTAAATPAFLSRLADLLKDEDEEVRDSAAKAIGKIGTAAATDLILSRLADLLKDEDENVRDSAAYAIGNLGTAAATDLILSRLADLLKDKDENVRSSAAYAIREIGAAAATPAFLSRLADLLKDEDGDVRSSAAKAIGNLGTAAATDLILSRLAKLLKNNNEYVRSSAAEAIGNLGTAAATDLILSRLAKLLKNNNEYVRSSAAEAIGKIGAAAKEVEILVRLADWLKDENWHVRSSAAYAISEIGVAAVTEVILSRLADLLTDKNWHVRSSAAKAIGNLGTAAATESILSRLASLLKDEYEYVRSSAAKAMGEIGVAAATELILSRLADLLKDEDGDVRSSAAYAIREIGAAAATPAFLSRLADLLKVKKWVVRSSAAYVIGEIGAVTATELILSRLADLLKDEDEDVRRSAAEALRQMHVARLRLFVNDRGKLHARSVTELSR